ncbi:MAG: hypothetical protein ACHQ16_03120, partial [Candidatus Lutacidiplasmatales archaeon]
MAETPPRSLSGLPFGGRRTVGSLVLLVSVAFALLVLPAATGGWAVGGALSPTGRELTRPAPDHRAATLAGPPVPARATVRPDAGIGTVLSTLDLATNQLLPGATAPGLQNSPTTGVLDNQNGRIYIRSGPGNDISVVQAASHRDIADIPVPYSQQVYFQVPSIAVDTANGYLYAANVNGANVSVIDSRTNQVTGSISTGGSPYGILFDPANGDLYVSNYGGDNITVISGATNRTVANIHAGTSPGAMALDSAHHELFVANYFSNNVTVVNTTSNLAAATIAVGTNPIAVVVNTVSGLVDVVNVNGAQGNVSVLNPVTNTLGATVRVGSVPEAAAFDAARDRLYVANGASNNVSVVDDSNGSVDAAIATGHGAGPNSIVYDAMSGDLYVACAGSQNITVINPATNRSVANLSTGTLLPASAIVDLATNEVYVVDGQTTSTEANVTVVSGATNRAVASVPLEAYPTSIAYDPVDGQVYVANGGGNDTFWLDPSTNRIGGAAGVGPWPDVLENPLVFDSANHDLYVLNPYDSTVLVIGPARTLVATIGVGLTPIAIAFDAANGFVYVANNYDGNVTVINGSTNHVVGSLLVKMYETLDALVVDPTTNELYVADGSGNNVTVFGATNFSKLATIPVGNSPRAMVYDTRNGTILVGNFGSGNLSVISDTTQKVVGSFPFPSSGVLLYDNLTDSVYNAAAFSSVVYAVNASTYQPLAGSPLQLRTGTYTAGIALDPTSGLLYVSTEYSGTISVIGTSTTYPVNFVETGLANTTTWSVTLGGVGNSSSGTTIGFHEPNGSYAFSVAAVSGYAVNRSSGTVNVSGGTVSVAIGFSTSGGGGNETYAVTFTESGLTGSPTWTVTLGGVLRSSATTTVAFTEPNGAYPFLVGSPVGFSGSPGTGSVPVSGGPASRSIVFVAVPPGLTVSLVIAPSSVAVGSSSTISTTASGGVSPYSYSYSGLPPGCASANAATIDCTPTAAGTFEVLVSVTDHDGNIVGAGEPLKVTAAAGNSPNSGGGASGSSWVWWILILVVVIVAFLIVFAWRRKRRPPEPAGAPGSSGPGAAGPAGS